MKVVKPTYQGYALEKTTIARNGLLAIVFAYIFWFLLSKDFMDLGIFIAFIFLIGFNIVMFFWRLSNPSTIALYKDYVILNNTHYKTKGMTVEGSGDWITIRDKNGESAKINPYRFPNPEKINKYFFRKKSGTTNKFRRKK